MNERTFRGLRWAVLALAAVAGIAFAEEFVVLSLVGRQLTVVTARGQTGTHIDQNEYASVPLADTAFDDVALLAAESSIKAARPGATVTKLRAPANTPTPAGDAWASEANLKPLLGRIAQDAKPGADARLLLVLPYRAEPQMLTYAGYRGSGSAAGLGFYLDWMSPINREATAGWLGTFVNAQIVLVDLAGGTIVAQAPMVAGVAHSAARAKSPWDALSPEDKVKSMRDLLESGIVARVPAMAGGGR